MHGGAFSEDEPMAEINMIPLIDIALTLLIILMVTTTFARKPGVNLKLPETVTREGAQPTPQELTVDVSSNGELFLNAQPVTVAELQAQLRERAATDKEARVLIRGDRAVIYSRMMEVMDIIRQAGLTRVVLPTDPKTLQQSVPSASVSGRGFPFRDQATGQQGENTPSTNAVGTQNTGNPVGGTTPNTTGAGGNAPNPSGSQSPNDPTTQRSNREAATP